MIYNIISFILGIVLTIIIISLISYIVFKNHIENMMELEDYLNEDEDLDIK